MWILLNSTSVLRNLITLCSNYYCIGDLQAIKNLCGIEQCGRVTMHANQGADDSVRKKIKKRKSAWIYIIRTIIWKMFLLRANKLKEWVKDFCPSHVIVQAGDFPVLFDLARYIAKKYSARLIVYNTEGYYFKEKSYFSTDNSIDLFYSIWHRYFKAAYKKLTASADEVVYNCELLKTDYDRDLGTKSSVIYASSEFAAIADNDIPQKLPKIVYAGNLGLNRYKCLIEFASALNTLGSQYVLDVYSANADPDIIRALKTTPSLRYNGSLPYSALKSVLLESQYLLHVESFDENLLDELKYAFSTKIADSLASGSCLILYAPTGIAATEYLLNNDAAYIITEQNALIQGLKSLFESGKDIDIVHKSRLIASENHSIDKNGIKFKKLILGS